MSEWIKCSERMPSDKYQSYLVVVKNHLNDANPKVASHFFLEDNYKQNELGEWERNGFCWCYEGIGHNTRTVGEDGNMQVVTHWMPYPLPPEEPKE